jgi:glyoxylase-like metal-dependent hydrolase (beta-lactamase superfamily II)
MYFKQFHLESLGHTSYLIGSEETGEAFVLDVRRGVEAYFSEARAQGMRIRYAADTHQHNDYLSGICELPARGEVQLLAGALAVVWLIGAYSTLFGTLLMILAVRLYQRRGHQSGEPTARTA